MKISEIFNLQKTQYELDFVDIDVDKDIPLFLDPYFISKMEFPFAENAYKTIKNYFDHLLGLLRGNHIREAKEIFSYLGETNEICLGMSKGKPSGRGMGPKDADKLFESLMQSKAYQTGLMEDIEDFRIFVPNVDKDKVSDMVANIIKWHLIEYTQNQCKLWGMPLQEGVPSGAYWDSDKREWTNQYTDMLIVGGKKVILVPKRVVSYSKEYADKNYLQHYVLNFMQNEHLRLNSSLVRKRVKSKERYVTKKAIREYESHKSVLDKKWLADFTLRHPEVFAQFKKDCIKRINFITNEELDVVEVRTVTEYLKNKLLNIPKGSSAATEYHRTIVGIMELLFYPYLAAPKIEEEIHDGRKRMDIVFDNCADFGFFHRLSTSYDVPSRFIIVECKNYSRDIKNPELDQLSGRFSPNRGKFGIAACREIEDMSTFLARCNDTVKDNRGVIIPLVDSDFVYMLENFENNNIIWEEVLQERFHEVCIN